MERERTVRRLDPSFHQPKYQPQLGSYTVRPLGEICERVLCGPFGSAIKSTAYVAQGVPFIRITNIRPGEFDASDLVYISEDDSERLGRTRLNAGDLIISQRGTVGNVCQIPESIPVCNISANTIGVKPGKQVNPRYLLYFLISHEGQKQFQRTVSGHVQAKITTGDVENIRVPLPPRSVQDAVADAMDAAYRRQRALQAEAQALLDSIDGYVLDELGIKLPELEENRHFVQMAVSVRGGRLTPYYYQPKLTIVTEILNSRKDIAYLGDLAASINNGIEIRRYVGQGTPYLRVSDMKADGIDLSDVRRVVKEANEIPHRIRLREGDLLISRSGTLGMVAMVTTETTDCIISSHIRRIALKQKFKDQVNPLYAVEFLRTEVGQRQFFQRNNGTVVPEIDREALSTIMLPIPSRPLQDQIATEVQNRRQRAAALRQQAAQVVAEARAAAERAMLGQA